MNNSLIRWSDLTRRSLQATDGEIGRVKDVLFDDENFTVRYFVVRTGPWLVGQEALISPKAILDLTDEDHIPVDLTKEQIKNSPSYESEKPLSRQFEHEFHQFYGYPPYWSGALVGPELAPAGTLPPQAGDFPTTEHLKPQQGDPHLRSCRELRSYTISARGDEIGYVDDFVFEAGTWALRHLVTDTSIWPGSEKFLVPCEVITGIQMATETVNISLTKKQVEVTPRLDSDEVIDREYEDDLYGHIKVEPYWQKAEGRLHPNSPGLSPSQR